MPFLVFSITLFSVFIKFTTINSSKIAQNTISYPKVSILIILQLNYQSYDQFFDNFDLFLKMD